MNKGGNYFHYRSFKLILLLLSFLTTSQSVIDVAMAARNTWRDDKMNCYHLGRFSVDVPTTMQLEIQTSKLRMTNISEVQWPRDVSHEEAREMLWRSRLAEITKLEAPPGKKQALIETRIFNDFGVWAKGAFYHGNNMISSEGKWDVLIDAGKTAVWLRTDSLLTEPLNVEKAVHNLRNLANAYRRQYPVSTMPAHVTTYFYVRNGAIDLPYRWQEQTYARFEGHPLDLKLEIEMQNTHHVEQAGLMERLGNALVSRYVLGVNVDKIRGRKRTVAGLKGEDVILRMKDKYNTMLSFAWEYAGEENSGERPEIQITMESPDGDLEEKIKVWDLILDSFKPMYPRKN